MVIKSEPIDEPNMISLSDIVSEIQSQEYWRNNQDQTHCTSTCFLADETSALVAEKHSKERESNENDGATDVSKTLRTEQSDVTRVCTFASSLTDETSGLVAEKRCEQSESNGNNAASGTSKTPSTEQSDATRLFKCSKCQKSFNKK